MSSPDAGSARRSLLYVPADSRRKLDRAAQSAADTLILDLEDGVAPDQKDAALATLAAALGEVDFGHREVLVRLNPWTLGRGPQEIASTALPAVHGYVVPKVDRPADLTIVADALAPHAAGRAHPFALFAMVETPAALVNLAAISAVAARYPLQGLIFGAEDYSAHTRIERTPGGLELLFARSTLVAHAAVYGLAVIDAVYLSLSDDPGLAAECEHVRTLGFSGKTAIHPHQLATINQAFTPAPAAVDRARRLCAAYAAHTAAGSGVFVFEGKAVDLPVIVWAQRLLATHAVIEAVMSRPPA
jgi:citrate lyase subunit beta / citryl-CoA lyase